MSETNGHAPRRRALTKADFQSDQETRWCPGCGDYAILAAVQGFMPELGIPPERIVFVTGIGCAGRFAYYMDTYGMHGIHGRAPALATGLATTRPDLVDLGRHRRRRRALDRRQPPDPRAAPQRAGEDPAVQQPDLRADEGPGLADQRARQGHQVDAVRLAPTARSTRSRSRSAPEATFVARTLDTRPATTSPRCCARRPRTRGTAFVEIYQNCPVFNDGAFDALTEKRRARRTRSALVHGEPIRFGADSERGVVRDADGDLRIVDAADVGEDALLVHDAHREDPSLAFALARLADRPTEPTPIGVFRAVERPLHGAAAVAAGPRAVADTSMLDALLNAGDTWTVARVRSAKLARIEARGRTAGRRPASRTPSRQLGRGGPRLRGAPARAGARPTSRGRIG